MTDEEKAKLRLNSSGSYVGTQSMLQNIIVTSYLTGKDALTLEELHDLCINALIAGSDTTASALACTTYLIARGHDRTSAKPPTAQDTPFIVGNQLWQDLVAEQEAMIREHGRDNGAYERPQAARAALKDMPYLTACIRESMRLIPVVQSVMRQTKEDITAGRYTISAGSTI